jgi:hypothetical protein
MQLNIRLNAMAVVVAAALAIGGWLLFAKLTKPSISIETSTVAAGVPVVMRTTGGLLEIATVTAYERFTRSDTRQFWGIPLGTTISFIQAPVVYRYHIAMAKEWPISIHGKTAVVRAGEVKPSLPVAFDTTRMEKYTQSGWARFNKDENLASLEQSITPELQVRSNAAQYRQMATDAGRLTVAEFVTTWLLKEQQWKRDADHKVVVVFPGENLPAFKAPSSD